MPKFYNEEKLKELLLENRVPITDAVNRGEFYRQYFNGKNYFSVLGYMYWVQLR